MTALTGSWSNSPTRYGYQWQDCTSPSPGVCSNIDGATDPQYTVQSSDVGNTLDVIVTASNAGGSTSAASNVSAAVSNTAPSYTVVAVGDIACAPGSTASPTTCQQAATEALAKAQNPDAVLVLGDNQYNAGLFSEYTAAGTYNDTWGAAFGCALLCHVNPIVHPVPGNHEYHTSPTAAGYFQYFGQAIADPNNTPNGYYSFNLGTWHIDALNSDCSDSGGCVDGVAGNTTLAQTQWLQSDLAANPSSCVLAMWHHPRFSWGFQSDSTGVGPLWDVLYNAHADLILNGHDHVYERFAQQDPLGNPTPNGIREFVVGTGGENLMTLSKGQKNLEFGDDQDFGVLVLTLHPSSYDYKFIATSGQVIDSGTSVPCHGPGPSGTASVANAREMRAGFTQGPSGRSLAFDAHPLHSSLTAAEQRGLPVAVYTTRSVNAAITVSADRAGRLHRIASFWETESEIVNPYSLIYLRLPRRQLGHLRRVKLVLRFAVVDAAHHRLVMTRTMRLNQS